MKQAYLLLALSGFFISGWPREASGQCVVSLGVGPTSASTLNFRIQGTLLTASQVQAGIDMWKTCGQYGIGFPSMAVNSSGSVNIVIQHIAGANPNPNSACGQSTWSYSGGQLTGGTINLFDTTTGGGDCEPTMAETIAHEIGHALGMGDVGSSCLPDIMGPNNLQSGSRRVLSQDCSDVDSHWTTPQEAPPPPSTSTTSTEPGGWGCGSLSCDPLVLDLNGDGIETTGPADPVWFDVDGDGVKEHVTWTNGNTMEGFLWIDLNHKNRVDDGSELFGVGTVMPDGTRPTNGFQALDLKQAKE